LDSAAGLDLKPLTLFAGFYQNIVEIWTTVRSLLEVVNLRLSNSETLDALRAVSASALTVKQNGEMKHLRNSQIASPKSQDWKSRFDTTAYCALLYWWKIINNLNSGWGPAGLGEIKMCDTDDLER
jgi:hypothetical protein